MSQWTARAEHYLEQALAELRADTDPLGSISAADACVRIGNGEMEPDEELLSDEPLEVPCTCPPELRARGSFTSTCRADHGSGETGDPGA